MNFKVLFIVFASIFITGIAVKQIPKIYSSYKIETNINKAMYGNFTKSEVPMPHSVCSEYVGYNDSIESKYYSITVPPKNEIDIWELYFKNSGDMIKAAFQKNTGELFYAIEINENGKITNYGKIESDELMISLCIDLKGLH